MHNFVLYISLALILFVMVAFLFVAVNTNERDQQSDIQGATSSLRTKLLWLMIGIGIPLSMSLAFKWPHAAFAETRSQIIVTAISGQWYWDISHTELPVGAPVIFELTTNDVNHGFGLYDEDMTLVTQAQAMPGVTNRLHHVFDKTGIYTVACLEYCGVAHHAMMTEIAVVDPALRSSQADANGGN